MLKPSQNLSYKVLKLENDTAYNHFHENNYNAKFQVVFIDSFDDFIEILSFGVSR